jgi:peptidoglycan hydrolase-like protein with peptidoglycan-binding domain
MAAMARLISANTRRLECAGMAVTAMLLLGVPVLAADAEPNGATIQWAQTILDEKGFYQGRASGRLDSTTAAAITAFQRKSGLKATGRLDTATIERLMEGREPPPTVGNLADPGSRAKPSSPILKESEIAPKAAPAAPGVQRDGGSEQALTGGLSSGPVSRPPVSGGAASTATPTISPTTPPAATGPGLRDPVNQPQSAARPEVSVEGQAGSGFSEASSPVPLQLVQVGLLVTVAALIAGMLFVLWRSGRRASRPVRAAARPTAPVRTAGPLSDRREPSLGGTLSAVPGGGLRAANPPIRRGGR